MGSMSAWQPPQWSQPPMVLITVPAGYTTSAPSGTQLTLVDSVATMQTTVRPPSSYVFDAVTATDHDQALTKTRHPVQTGSAISSHAYIEPASLVLYVLMSDAVAAYSAGFPGASPYIQPWTGSPSKSISAYQQILNLQSLRIPLTVTTRLRTYYNMLIDKVSPREEAATISGARFRLELGQIFIASTQSTPLSVRPNDTQVTGLGTVNVQPPAAIVQQQFGVKAYGPGGIQNPPLPPDLGNGTTPCVQNGVPGYLTGPGGGPVSAATPAQDIAFVPQYPNSTVAVNIPGASSYSSNIVQTNSLATGVN